MRVRYLSGNATGGEEEVPDVVGESLLATGFAERVPDRPVEPVSDESPPVVTEPVP